ncbi:DUF2059 domain-containing protein [Shewanella eurypsychrophilus]|uniref:DUF2059 domain-containing protein n=1 Tax=Shewanella eurypsychrophilus TaxID=2593656 RepID=A0ABX6V1P6_9GAMM|nr:MULTISPECIES: DUF2059 domain-containing protein [Shewanella]QFU21246.1 DUF2059 domain-containing protein [Shewanella sp. YLB-09]QPG56537.1 DUF2059 domain-containing protein [Shewanella eurypsychrophilus]
MKILAPTSLILALLIAFSSPSHAEQTSHQAAAQAVLDATFAQDVIPQAMYQLKANFAHMVKDLPLKTEHREIETKYREQAFKLAQKRLNWQQIQPQLIQLYTSTYNQLELKEIAAFYRTETGKKYLKNMPATLRQSSQLVQAQMRDIKGEFNQIVSQLTAEAGVTASSTHHSTH